jgi:uncharacterized protein (TIGR00297 family)
MERRSEAARRLVHLGSGSLAFLLKYLTPAQAAGCAAAAFAFNYFLLPRIGGGSLFRIGETRRPWRSGILLYPISVFLLVVLFHDRMEVAAAGWAMMAAGDPAASALGRALGRRPLPWNRGKTMAGTAAFAGAAGVGAWAVLSWMGRGPWEALLLAVPASLFAAFVESLPWRLDDNLTVPLLSALFLRGLLEVDPERLRAAAPGLRHAFLVAVAVNLVLALVFRRSGAVDRSGMVAGFLIGLLTFTFTGWGGFAVLLSFFVLGSAATRLGYRRKQQAGIAQERRGARSARHALANCGVGVYLAFLAAAAGSPEIFLLAFVCAYATAAFDTVSGEVGQAYGGRPVMITTLRPVPAGTDGAISWLGTFAGTVAALIVGGISTAAGLLPRDQVGIVAVAALLGSTADSILGATLETKGLMDNEAVNFSNTLVGALAGVGIAGALSLAG